jgi:hypothetical protein
MVANKKVYLASLGLLFATGTAVALDSTYRPTAPGTIEVKRLPAARAMQSSAPDSYFDASNTLFYNLFNYLNSNNLGMTTPVEAEVLPGKMRFYLGKEAPASLRASEKVQLVTLPERTVVSIGLKGGYSSAAFQDGVRGITTWLRAHPEWEASGPAYGVYWDGPMTPWFLKESEVHQPVRQSSRR